MLLDVASTVACHSANQTNSPDVTTSVSCLNKQQLCPQNAFVDLIRISEQTAIVSLNRIKKLIFVIYLRSVFSAVWTKCLETI
jgi:hypothetical protein